MFDGKQTHLLQLFDNRLQVPDCAAATGGDIDHAVPTVGIVQNHHAAFEELTLVGKMVTVVEQLRRPIDLCQFKGKLYINQRMFYESLSGELLPTKKGITLPVEVALAGAQAIIEAARVGLAKANEG